MTGSLNLDKIQLMIYGLQQNKTKTKKEVFQRNEQLILNFKRIFLFRNRFLIKLILFPNLDYALSVLNKQRSLIWKEKIR